MAAQDLRRNNVKYRIDTAACVQDVWGERGINQPYSDGM